MQPTTLHYKSRPLDTPDIEKEGIPRIATTFGSAANNETSVLYLEAIRKTLERILPPDLFHVESKNPDVVREIQNKRVNAFLPFISHTVGSEAPSDVSFYTLFKYRANAFKFFFEMVSSWLVPGKRLNVLMVYAVDFSFPDISSDLYTLCEVMLRVDTDADLEVIQRNLPIIEMELRQGLDSNFYARRIMEIKGFCAEEKTAMVQESITRLLKRLPKQFDSDLITEMQHVLVICSDEFKRDRSPHHLSRIIAFHYLYRRNIRQAIKHDPQKRFLNIKLFRTWERREGQEKRVLGIVVGLNFLKDGEVFQQRHILNAIKNYIPSARAVEGSFFSNRKGAEAICTLYFEIEKEGNIPFTGEDIDLLRRELPLDLQDRIEQVMHPVFMPRNEEEIMRNVLSLSAQLKYVRDIPQAMITFEEQTATSLFFTIILVRVLKPGMTPIADLFKSSDVKLGFMSDRCKTVGKLRNKYSKEANVFRLKLPKNPYLRRDHSIDLYKARQDVFQKLCSVVGEVRDFNGGMISKQHEVLTALKELMNGRVKYNDLLLENFFYSIIPVVMRTVLEPPVLKTLFLMQLEALESNKAGVWMNKDAEFIYLMVGEGGRAVKEELLRFFNKMNHTPNNFANSYLKVQDKMYLGYIFRCDSAEQQESLLAALRVLIKIQ